MPAEMVAVERMVSGVIFDVVVDVGLESVVGPLVREIAGTGHEQGSGVCLPADQYRCPSEVAFQPPAVIVIVIFAARRRPW